MLQANRYRSWGRPAPPTLQAVHRKHWCDDPLPNSGRTLLPFGNGRSYGDSCLSADGALVDVRGLNRFISFDTERGVLRCEAGVLLAEILVQSVPRGWFVPVTPGTQFVTVGGAIANDVHGKNHHCAGSFGHHVRCLELERSDGSRILCSPEENPDWFAATIGGLGLTGVILWAEIALKPVPGPVIMAETVRFSGLDEFFELTRDSHERYEYTVAWIDCLGSNGSRGLFYRGNHTPTNGTPVNGFRQVPGVPFTPPFSLLSYRAARLFNAAIYYQSREARTEVDYRKFFYPLDAVPHWNRAYGRRGFYQYQCVVPYETARDALDDLLGRIKRAGEGSVLSVLKVFGDQPSRGLLSFARPGVTLALDFPDLGTSTLQLLDTLDEVVLAAGGALYPAKDARMSPQIFQQGFPRWHELQIYRDPRFMSDFWRRVTATAV